VGVTRRWNRPCKLRASNVWRQQTGPGAVCALPVHLCLCGIAVSLAWVEPPSDQLEWSAPTRTAKTVPAHVERRFFPETRVTAFRLANAA